MVHLTPTAVIPTDGPVRAAIGHVKLATAVAATKKPRGGPDNFTLR